MERWKDIPGYEGHFQASDLGRIKSLNRTVPHSYCGYKTVRERIRKACLSRGYLRVSLRKHGTIKCFFIHQLVAMAFLNHNPCGHSIQIDHIDKNVLNNKLSNHQIITARNHKIKDGIRGSSEFVGVSLHRKTEKWVARIYDNGKEKHLGLFKTELEASSAYQKALNNIYIKEYRRDEWELGIL